ncbi:MAG: hypothetical protein KKH28_09350 [Elusimicrobia bacterium]|nr:hypothetical protein [Elusimicrobiota bacterium]
MFAHFEQIACLRVSDSAGKGAERSLVIPVSPGGGLKRDNNGGEEPHAGKK